MTAPAQSAPSSESPVFPGGPNARVLLSSIFGPYAQDDEYGSRAINPMELYHNQVTRTQGAFSLRMFHRSFGLMLLQANMDAPCTLIDFPTLESFAAQLESEQYDVVGISAPFTATVHRVLAVGQELRRGAPPPPRGPPRV